MTTTDKLTRAVQAFHEQQALVIDLECRVAKERDEMRRMLGDIQELRHELGMAAVKRPEQASLWEAEE